jgi:hypothetical protein
MTQKSLKGLKMKLEYLLAIVVLLIMGASAIAQPPACVGDQCSAASVESAKSAPQHSIVSSRTYATTFGANHPVLTAPVRVPLKAAKAVGIGVKRVGKGALKVGKAIIGIERRQARRAAGRGLFACWRCH